VENCSLPWDLDKQSLGKLVLPRPECPAHEVLLWTRLFRSSHPQHPLANGIAAGQGRRQRGAGLLGSSVSREHFVRDFLPWLGLSRSRREKGLEGEQCPGWDGGSGREGERQDVALPRAQGSSMSLAQIWSGPLRSPVSGRCTSRPIVLSGGVPVSHH